MSQESSCTHTNMEEDSSFSHLVSSLPGQRTTKATGLWAQTTVQQKKESNPQPHTRYVGWSLDLLGTDMLQGEKPQDYSQFSRLHIPSVGTGTVTDIPQGIDFRTTLNFHDYTFQVLGLVLLLTFYREHTSGLLSIFTTTHSKCWDWYCYWHATGDIPQDHSQYSRLHIQSVGTGTVTDMLQGTYLRTTPNVHDYIFQVLGLVLLLTFYREHTSGLLSIFTTTHSKCWDWYCYWHATGDIPQDHSQYSRLHIQSVGTGTVTDMLQGLNLKTTLSFTTTHSKCWNWYCYWHETGHRPQDYSQFSRLHIQSVGIIWSKQTIHKSECDSTLENSFPLHVWISLPVCDVHHFACTPYERWGVVLNSL